MWLQPEILLICMQIQRKYNINSDYFSIVCISTFSKKFENHCHFFSLYIVYYNFYKIHKSLSVTPAMQAGLTKKQ